LIEALWGDRALSRGTGRGALLAALIALALFTALGPSVIVAQDDDTPEPTRWEVLDQREAEGQQCIVCRQQIHEGDIVEVRYRGRTFFVAAKMLEEFEADPERYFRTLQARGALFDEAARDNPPMRTGWLGFGVYVMLGLLFGAACAYLALDRGLPAWGWFFAGLALNVLALVTVITRPREAGAPAAAGLVKIPTTLTPTPCPHCGNTNHPSAATCSGCGHALEPTIEPETARS
jgi:YHS domain-containing protein